MEVDPDLLVGLFAVGERKGYTITKGLPVDARLVGIDINVYGVVELGFESPSWEPVPEGEMAGMVMVEVRSEYPPWEPLETLPESDTCPRCEGTGKLPKQRMVRDGRTQSL